MSVTVNSKVLRDVRTTAEWTTDNPIIPDRVEVYDSTIRLTKVGDGITAWVSLPYWGSSFTPLAPASYPFAAGTLITGQFIPSTGGFTEIATLKCIDSVTGEVWDVMTPVANSPFTGWTITLPVDTGGTFNTVNACVVWVKA